MIYTQQTFGFTQDEFKLYSENYFNTVGYKEILLDTLNQ